MHVTEQTGAGVASSGAKEWHEDLPGAYAAQTRERHAAGCYEIFEAAKLIAKQIGLSEAEEKELLDALALAAFEEKLPVRSPRGFNKFAPTKKPSYAYDYCALVHVDDVNAWARLSRCSWQWTVNSAPDASPQVGSRKMDDAWKQVALERARQLIVEHVETGRDWKLSLTVLANMIHAEKTIRGPLNNLQSASTIRTDALNGSGVLDAYNKRPQSVLNGRTQLRK